MPAVELPAYLADFIGGISRQQLRILVQVAGEVQRLITLRVAVADEQARYLLFGILFGQGTGLVIFRVLVVGVVVVGVVGVVSVIVVVLVLTCVRLASGATLRRSVVSVAVPVGLVGGQDELVHYRPAGRQDAHYAEVVVVLNVVAFPLVDDAVAGAEGVAQF